MKTANPFVPAFITCMREGYSFKLFRADVIAGLTVAIVALPLAMAMAVASGASPDKGLVTAVVAGFFISFLGGSRVQIGGPTGAFVVVIFDVIQRFGFNGLILASIMAGIILVIAGYAKLGKLIKYIPYPVITGFTTGIAVIIASSQVKDFLGLSVQNVPADFLNKWYVYLTNLDQTSVYAVILGALGLATIIICKKVSPKIPSYLVSILLISAIAFFFTMPVDTIGSRFPNLPEGLPTPVWPTFSLEEIRELVPSAFTIAFLAGIEALLSAVVADGLIGHKHSLNQELVGQGVANIASGIFGGIPATGAIARTATNIRQGGNSPLAGIIHAITLCIILLFLAPYAVYIPLASMAAILFVVAYNMSDAPRFVRMLILAPRPDQVILLLTFFLTIFTDLVVAVNVGVVLAVLQFMRKMVNTIDVHEASCAELSEQIKHEITIHPDIMVYTVEGPLFFGAISAFDRALNSIHKDPKYLIIRFVKVPFVDLTGLRILRSIIEELQKRGIEVLLSDVSYDIRREMYKSDFLDILGRHHMYRKFDSALHKAEHDLALLESKEI